MPETGSKATILCIEDEPRLRQDILDELAAAGYRTIGARDGLDALAMLETTRPDLILCDISMPRLDGYSLLDTVRSDRPELAATPFVFLTALSERNEIIAGKRAGADDYLVKPIDYDLMLATIESRLEQMRRIDEKVDRDVAALRNALPAFETSSQAGIRRVLDILSFGVVVIEASGVAFANRAAQAIHDAGDGLVIDDTLHTGSAICAAEVRGMLAEACLAAERHDDFASSISVPRPSGKRDLLLTVCALPGGPAASRDDAQAVVFVSDPAQPPDMPRQALAKLFDLTPAEADVAAALACGKRTDRIAEELGVSQTTVAFHLRNLFEKTGTHRQAELIALILTGLGSIIST